jgi:hypothetical protein
VDVEIELRFLAIFFAGLLLVQALLLLAWGAARGVLRGIAAMRRVPAVEPNRPAAAAAQPSR